LPQWFPLVGQVRRLSVLFMLLAASGQAAAQNVPLPRPRPASLLERFATPPQSAPSAPLTTALAPAPELHAPDPTEPAPGPSPCELRLAELAAFTPLPTIAGPGECGAVDVVRLEAVLMPDKSRVTVNPPATLRCSMAEAVATWMRQDVGPSAASLGAPLAAIQNYDSFDCRGRNRVVGARLSEHGKANALDIRALRLADGRVIDPTSPIVSKGFREALRSSACARFMTARTAITRATSTWISPSGAATTACANGTCASRRCWCRCRCRRRGRPRCRKSPTRRGNSQKQKRRRAFGRRRRSQIPSAHIEPAVPPSAMRGLNGESPWLGASTTTGVPILTRL
jgi:hypothetical protein